MDDWDDKARRYANDVVAAATAHVIGSEDRFLSLHRELVAAYQAGAIAGIERCQEILHEQASK